MKAKLLKKLRLWNYINYYPSTKQFEVIGRDKQPMYYNRERDAKLQMECNIINYAREHYKQYVKRTRIN